MRGARLLSLALLLPVSAVAQPAAPAPSTDAPASAPPTEAPAPPTEAPAPPTAAPTAPVTSAPATGLPAETLVAVVPAAFTGASVRPEFLRSVFLGHAVEWPDGTRAVPLLRASDTPAAHAFFETVLDMSAGRYAQFWSQREFSGQGVRPRIAPTPDAAARAVAGRPGAVGFGLAGEFRTLPGGVKLVPVR